MTMLYMYATIHTLGVTLRERADAVRSQNRDHGASTIEIVFWAAGALALAAIVYAAINAYISGKVAKIK